MLDSPDRFPLIGTVERDNAQALPMPTSAPSVNRQNAGLAVSVVIPCLNERESIVACIERSHETLAAGRLAGEVLVVDNGSTDGSAELARAAGARVVGEPRRGYGRAYRAGFEAARGRYIVMGDADGTYDFSEIPRFVEQLETGADLVLGTRLNGTIQPGAMPWLHRYVGNPVLTGLLNALFETGVSDSHCGMRAFRRDALPELQLRSTGMELASEQVVRCSKLGFTIREIPIAYSRRLGESKLSRFSDGWRHIRLLLQHAPRRRLALPGVLVLLTVLLSLASVQLAP